jgi:hypothetical protein
MQNKFRWLVDDQGIAKKELAKGEWIYRIRSGISMQQGDADGYTVEDLSDSNKAPKNQCRSSSYGSLASLRPSLGG